jgi:large subunit ribosomal protein L10
MALKKAKKAELIESYTEALKNSKSAVYVKFKGLPVSETMQLRNNLYGENTRYTVVKKTLWNIATQKVGIKGDAPVVGEELAVVYGEDLLAPARLSHEFAKTHKDTFAILGGIWEGEFKDAKAMTAIATIPPKEVLLSQLAFLLKSPMQRLAVGIKAVADKKA